MKKGLVFAVIAIFRSILCLSCGEWTSYILVQKVYLRKCVYRQTSRLS